MEDTLKKYRNYVYYLLNKWMAKDRVNDIDDVYQEYSILLMEKLKDYDKERATMKTYVTMLARQAYREYWRQDKMSRNREDIEDQMEEIEEYGNISNVNPEFLYLIMEDEVAIGNLSYDDPLFLRRVKELKRKGLSMATIAEKFHVRSEKIKEAVKQIIRYEVDAGKDSKEILKTLNVRLSLIKEANED